MIINRTPFRISLFGGGSDYPAWYRKHGGSVLGFAINKYCYISLRELPPFFEHKHRIVYSQIEMVKEVEDIVHPSVRGVLQTFGADKGLEIHHDGDLPARSGLGSSSSFTVGLISALYALQGKMVTKQYLAEEAIHIEQDIIQEHVGSQDQVWAAFGGINRVNFGVDGSISVNPMIIDRERSERLNKNLLLFFTGTSRIAEVIAKKKISNLGNREDHVHKMVDMVDEAENIFHNPDRPLKELGELLHESWMLKRDLANGVTSSEIDTIYEAARDSGALGGKVLGAGGGGFMVFYVEPEKQKAVIDKLSNLLNVNYNFDMSGSKIVVFEPNGLESS